MRSFYFDLYIYIYKIFIQNVVQAVVVFNPLLLVPELHTNARSVLILITDKHWSAVEPA
jgi:hypothetical protein